MSGREGGNEGKSKGVKRWILEGDLLIWDQEGGHADPAIEVRNTTEGCFTLGCFLQEELCRRLPERQGRVPGRWRITVERLSE